MHPSRRNDVHEFYFICSDIAAFVRAMRNKGIRCGRVQALSWGRLTHVRLPGGGKLGVYQPSHPRPKRPRAR